MMLRWLSCQARRSSKFRCKLWLCSLQYLCSACSSKVVLVEPTPTIYNGQAGQKKEAICIPALQQLSFSIARTAALLPSRLSESGFQAVTVLRCHRCAVLRRPVFRQLLYWFDRQRSGDAPPLFVTPSTPTRLIGDAWVDYIDISCYGRAHWLTGCGLVESPCDGNWRMRLHAEERENQTGVR